MNYIKVSDLHEGQTFTHPVYIEDDTIFIPAGVPVREKDIQRLKKWKIEQLETEGAVSGSEGDSENTWGLPVDAGLFKFYNKTVEDLNEIFNKIRNNERVAGKEIETIVSSLVGIIEQKPLDSIRLVVTNTAKSQGYAKNAVNCTMLAAKVGIALGRPRHKLFQLCSGALLHKVGMQRIPKNILEKEGSLNSEDLKKLRTHPIHAYRIIKRELQLPEDIAQIALQRHERWDGGGYPQRLKGTEILFEARIIAVVDSFEALVSEKPWRNSLICYEAMRSILSDNQRSFDPEVVKIFIQTM